MYLTITKTPPEMAGFFVGKTFRAVSILRMEKT